MANSEHSITESDTIRHDNTNLDNSNSLQNSDLTSTKHVSSHEVLKEERSDHADNENSSGSGNEALNEYLENNHRPDKANDKTTLENQFSDTDTTISEDMSEKENSKAGGDAENKSTLHPEGADVVKVSDRRKWLREEAFRKELERTRTSRADALQTIAANQVSSRAGWLQEVFKKDNDATKAPLGERQPAKKNANISHATFAAEKKVEFDDQLKKSCDIANVSDNKSALEQSESEVEQVSNRAERPKVEFKNEDINSKSKIDSVAKKFGTLKKDEPPKKEKKMSKVQQQKLALEQLAREEYMKNNPKAFLKTSWKSKKTYGQYQKRTTDSRGVAPRKSLADLP